MPSALEMKNLFTLATVLQDVQVDSLGIAGTSFLFDQRGFVKPPLDFTSRALARIRFVCQEPRMHDRCSPIEVHRKLFCYVEYDFQVKAGSIAGETLRENGIHVPRGNQVQWLAVIPLPITPLVDRESCSEFQALQELCDVLALNGLTKDSAKLAVSGHAWFFVSGSPCLSCVGALLQLRDLLPRVVIGVQLGRFFVVKP
eukprot:gnl/MRDRNA2_/MRDRNA2_247852_c0_seq1.p1 gnl/MRDRNA2_/MRDRNA2_247852_c0~~gnl/MRDRNA2_/MRDRNA2_247852_c0_seq1.p1  ORF type:complete len:200 (+),score=28.91 gnl/MRDRNA2_/MRDRNA2_247852_c0_seq1:317-916(+)